MTWDIDKVRSVGFLRGKSRQGDYQKKTTDELGNTTTEHWHDQVDVNIKAPTIAVTTTTNEER